MNLVGTMEVLWVEMMADWTGLIEVHYWGLRLVARKGLSLVG